MYASEASEAPPDDDEAFCAVCGDPYPARRRALGYSTCLAHAEPRKTFTAVPVPKSSYIIATCKDQLKSPYAIK